MMMKCQFIFYLIIFLLCSVILSHAQYKLGEFTLEGDLYTWYDSAVALENTVLLRGELFTFTRKSPKSHAFYKVKSWRPIDLVYFGQEFHDVPALYDLEEDRLIIKNPLDITAPIELIKNQVSFFDIGGEHFEYISNKVGYRTKEYYHIIYRGDQLDLLYKIEKKLVINSGVLVYEENYAPLLKVGGTYEEIIRFSELKKLFPAYKKELKLFKKSIGLSGRLDTREKQKLFGRLVEYCDQLIQP
ncbi:MAG: hypothetical protein RIC53_07960 [Cyclobacteriaceae bacterium]